MKLKILIIDPQQDFCEPDGALYVSGAKEDSLRTAEMINRLGTEIETIRITLDSHQIIDIAHPIFWKDSDGKHPAPFTIITVDDIESGKYHTTNPAMIKRASNYVRQLATNDRYPLCIWPEHCLVGSWGHTIQTDIFESVSRWSREKLKAVDIVNKGANPLTEHYSALRADVTDPEDPDTWLNTDLIESLDTADVIAVLGQAKSHCVANTIRDIVDNFSDDSIRKICFIEDCSSNVAGFEEQGNAFVAEMKARGMNVATSSKFRP